MITSFLKFELKIKYLYRLLSQCFINASKEKIINILSNFHLVHVPVFHCLGFCPIFYLCALWTATNPLIDLFPAHTGTMWSIQFSQALQLWKRQRATRWNARANNKSGFLCKMIPNHMKAINIVLWIYRRKDSFSLFFYFWHFQGSERVWSFLSFHDTRK